MIYKRKKSRIHKRLRKVFFLLILLSVAVVLLFEAQAVPFTKKCVRKKAKSTATKVISNEVEKNLELLKYSYKDLASINYSDDGKVNSINTNSININKLKSKTIKSIQKQLDIQKLYKFSLPLGSFTDITLLSTAGPEIEISFVLTGSVNCEIKSKFESGGVNQTVHHMYLIVKAEIITLSPEYSERINFKTDYEIAQTVIVGNTPSTFADIVR